MDNKKELYYKLGYIMPKKDRGGAIKTHLHFNDRYMSYRAMDLETKEVIKSIFIKGYDYALAVDVLIEAYAYKPNWMYIEFF